jgi:hypothetical protein
MRVKDVDFGYGHISVRDGKGLHERVTVLPESPHRPLQLHLAQMKQIHERDLARGAGRVYVPFALQRKYPNAGRSWAWQYVFPSEQIICRSWFRGAASPPFLGEKPPERRQIRHQTGMYP